MAFTAKNLAIMAAVALAPAIATPAASATVGVSQIATEHARDSHVQTVQYGTPRGVSIPDVWDNKPAMSHRAQVLAANLDRKARAGTASASAPPARTHSAAKRGSNRGQFAVGALVALALVLAGITATQFIRWRGESLAQTTASRSEHGKLP
jgi:hypothetical protein